MTVEVAWDFIGYLSPFHPVCTSDLLHMMVKLNLYSYFDQMPGRKMEEGVPLKMENKGS